jgi:hypothetical protein
MAGKKQIENWGEWKESVWTTLERQGYYPGLIALEQYMRRSQSDKRCVDCGERGTVRQESGGLVPSVSFYYFCQECADYQEYRRVNG